MFPDAKTKDVPLEESGRELKTSTSEMIHESLTADERITTYEQVCQNNMNLKHLNLLVNELNCCCIFKIL